ncbi:MAG: ATP-dependent helicase Dna2 [Pseudomonadota bacterium]|jgi:hypothetical protein
MNSLADELRLLLVEEIEAELEAEFALCGQTPADLVATGNASYVLASSEPCEARLTEAISRVREGDYVRLVPCSDGAEGRRIDQLRVRRDARCLARDGDRVVFDRPLPAGGGRLLVMPPAPFLTAYEALGGALERLLSSAPLRALATTAPRRFQPEWLTFDACERLLVDDDRPLRVVQGPPGSGKTHLIAGLAAEVARRGGSVLVAAFTHRALRQVVDAMVRRAEPGDAPPAYREGNVAAVPEGAIWERELPPGASYRGRVLLCTATRVAMGWQEGPPADGWDLVIVDEASQLLLPFLMGAVALGRRAVVVGDPNQLPPVVKAASNQGLEVADALRWVSVRADGVAMRQIRRFNEPVCEFVSRRFYEGRLECVDIDRGGQRTRYLDGVAGARDGLRWVLHEGASAQEASVVVATLREIDVAMGGRSPFEDRALRYAVATPRREQVARVVAAIQDFPGLRGRVVVETVDRLQGETVDVVLYSPGEETPSPAGPGRDLSWTLSSRRLNVALSRGRYLAVVVASRRYAASAASRANPDEASRGVWRLSPIEHTD